MEACYQTLNTIYEIVKTDPAPTTYLCTPHEIILRHPQDWKVIEEHLNKLAKEQLVSIKHLDKIFISITSAGIAKAKAVKNNFISTHFSFAVEAKPEEPASFKH
jgi:hypothetical protein